MPRKLLVIYSAVSTFVSTTAEYLHSVRRYSCNHVFYINAHDAQLGVDLNEFDVVWLNYCCRLCFPGYVTSNVREALKAYGGLKLMSVQDEYDRTETLRGAIEELGFDVVLTCVPQDALGYVYPKGRFPRTEFITVLTGYVPEHLERMSSITPLERRPIVIGYRGRDIGARYGELGFWKFELGRRMKEVCLERGIRCDIELSEEARIYGESWYAFVESCRTMLGSESGSNVFDFDGSLEEQYRRMKRANPSLTYEEFRPYVVEREKGIRMGQISPRVFEAAALHTPMILLTGRYSGLIEAGEHYIELRKDFSNVEDVLRQAGDIGSLEAMAERAHRDLISSGAYSYRRFIELVDGIIERKMREGDRQMATAGSILHIERPAGQVTPEGHSASIEVPTVYPLDGSQYLRKEIDRLNLAYTREIERLRSEIKRLNGVLQRGVRTREMTSELVRRSAVRLLGRRPGLLVSRLMDAPIETFVKAWVLAKTAVSLSPVRTLLLEYLGDRKLRREIGFQSLLSDLFKVEIVRKAGEGSLRAREQFRVAVTFDPETGVMTLRSAAAGGGVPEGGELRSDSSLSTALRGRQLSSIVWDHSAIGWQVVCAPQGSRWLTVFVGEGGLHRFEALAELARRRPRRVAAILLSMVRGRSIHERHGSSGAARSRGRGCVE